MCGRRGGKPFLEAVRPTSSDGNCPSGYEACYQYNFVDLAESDRLNEEQKQDYDSTICVEEGKKDDPDVGCPITSIAFDLDSVPEEWRATFVHPDSIFVSDQVRIAGIAWRDFKA